MARVRDVAIEEVPPDLRPLYRRFATDYGPFANQVGVFAHRPPALRHIMGLLTELAEEAVLPRRYLEIAVTTVSQLNACAYCVAHHTPRLVEEGLPAAVVDRLLEPDCPGLDEVDRLVRDYAVAVTNHAGTLRDEIFTRLRVHFSEDQIVELTLRTALAGFFNRFNDALQIDIEQVAITDLLACGGDPERLPTPDLAADTGR